MKRTQCLVLLACSFYFVGCHPSEQPSERYTLRKYTPASAIPFSDIENVYIDELNEQPNFYVFAINRDSGDQGRGAYWGTLNEYGWVRFFESGPQVSLFQVAYLAVSGDDKHLAVETTGEGHPVLDVFALQKWLNFAPRGADRETPPLEPVATLNPYPFSFAARGWRGKHFVLTSRGRLDQLRERRNAGQANFSDEELASEEVYTFLWDVENDQIQRE